MEGRLQCAECGGILKEESVTHTQSWGDQLCRFEHVPALVCAQCGQVWLSAATSQRIDELIQEHAEPARFERVPVFSLAETVK